MEKKTIRSGAPFVFAGVGVLAVALTAGIGTILVIAEEPGTAAAACLVREPERATARRIASPTASTSTRFFSTTALGGSGSTA